MNEDNLKKAEHERKELNKKLIKRTYVSEMKKRNYKTGAISFLCDFIILFVALIIEELIVDNFFENYLWIRVIVLAVVVLCLTSIKEWLDRRLVAKKSFLCK